MRRISRLRQPSGLRCSSATRAIPPLSSQCGVTSSTTSTPTSRPRKAAPDSFSCLYSTKPEPIAVPASLRDGSLPGSLAHAPHDIVDYEDWESLPTQTEHVFRPLPVQIEAERETEISDPAYVPATIADGLTTVGPLERYWDRRDNWPKSQDFESFKARRKVQHPDVLELATKRALVEALVMRSLGQDLIDGFPIGGREELFRALQFEIQVGEDGEASLAGEISEIANDLDWQSWEKKEMISVATPTPAEAVKLKAAHRWTTRWKNVSLEDPKLKFVVTKRIFQLTGQLIPDYKLAEITTIRTLLGVLLKPAKPKTLTQEIQERKQGLVQLPNVAFAPKRVTRGDKDKALGRFKLIEKELAKREIDISPLSVGRNKEWAWLAGNT